MKPMTISASFSESDNTIVFAPKSFLGAAAFPLYRKAIDGAKYHAASKTNRAPIDQALAVLNRLKAAGFDFELTQEAFDAIKSYQASRERLRANAGSQIREANETLKKRGMTLYPYQILGSEWLASRKAALLADPTGVGKSIQSLLAAGDKVLVICPNVLKGNWKAEAGKWRPDLNVTILEGRGSFRFPKKGEMVVTNYDILEVVQPTTADGEVAPLKVKSPPLAQTDLIVDEAHMVKQYDSRRTKCVETIAQAIRDADGRSWLLTATPLLGKPGELWTVLQVAGIAHEAFGSYKNFFELFSGFKDKYGATHWGKPKDEVVDRLRRVSLRREKKEVLPDLPTKTYRILETSLDKTDRKLCDQALEDIQASGIDLESDEAVALLTKDIPATFDNISKARKALANAKIPTLLQLVDLYEAENEPLIVFSRHRGPIDVLAKREGWAVITGDNSAQAQEIAAAFQRGELKGIAATIQAGGIGLTLTRACNVLFVDSDWTPELVTQAEDRACRIGQDRGVIITNLVADHELDRHVAKVVRKKIAIIEKSVHASAVSSTHKPQVEMFDE